MKSLILLLFFVTAGLIPFTYAQQQAASRNDAMKASTNNTLKLLFPDFERDIANLEAKEKHIKPDAAIISSSFESRTFTNYKDPGAGKKSMARSLKSAPAGAAVPSNFSSKEMADKLKAAQAAHPVKPAAIPNQGSEVNNIPVKKKS
ncbi:hypothetical protein [Chitinophaga arvensicola]|uniref:Uncharacterized protein n=1 Tax=Chitinophaga arvensicola TaxID=29529 RepID=A0A1I0SD56_9BACT|nr:hypothetical protein [Chitinophaga arvensicola]SEW55764.1 hypothetical protein SAMN04488122_6473 [Chitinophaga arvensicola]